MRSDRRRSRKWAAPRKIAVALAGLLLSVALVSNLVHAGKRYFYCEAMGVLDADPCAAASKGERDDAPADDLQLTHADCCATLTVAGVPEGSLGQAPNVPRAAFVALLVPARLVVQRLSIDARRRTPAFERWRAPPRPPNERRAQLMVFLT